MSQFYQGVTAGSLPPTVATSYVTDVNSPAIPAANVLNVVGGTTTDINTDGVQTDGSSGSNTLTVQLTNRLTGTLTTTDATLTTILTLPLGATPSVWFVGGDITAYDITDSAGAGYSLNAVVKTDGASATEVGVEYTTELEDAAMVTADLISSASGNNLLIRVQGIAGKTVNWYAKIEFDKVT